MITVAYWLIVLIFVIFICFIPVTIILLDWTDFFVFLKAILKPFSLTVYLRVYFLIAERLTVDF